MPDMANIRGSQKCVPSIRSHVQVPIEAASREGSSRSSFFFQRHLGLPLIRDILNQAAYPERGVVGAFYHRVGVLKGPHLARRRLGLGLDNAADNRLARLHDLVQRRHHQRRHMGQYFKNGPAEVILRRYAVQRFIRIDIAEVGIKDTETHRQMIKHPPEFEQLLPVAPITHKTTPQV